MTREIKFRAFVIRSEASDKINTMRYESNEVIFGWIADGVTLKLMQYTGRKDKRGKEIYDGDILQGNDGITTGRKQIYSVFWDEAGEWNIHQHQKIKVQEYDEHIRQLYNRDAEVIGDIHTSPDLLEH